AEHHALRRRHHRPPQSTRERIMSADLTFRKSSYSAHSQNCVEVASSDYRKSSHSAQDQDCVEVADSSHAVAIRDSKHAEAGHLAFSPAEWDAFLRGAKVGGF